MPNRSVVGSWHGERVTAITAEQVAAHGEAVPPLEVYTQPRAGCYAEPRTPPTMPPPASAPCACRWQLGGGTARSLAAGLPIAIRQHPRHDGAVLVLLAVERVAI